MWFKNKGKKIQIAGVSDVSVGYSTPQILAFMKSLVEHYGSEGILFEPDQPERPARPEIFTGLPIRPERVKTPSHPHQRDGRIQYTSQVAKRLNKLRPQVVVIFCSFSLPALFKLNYQPSLVIYYSVELISLYGEVDVEMNRHLTGLVDLIIFPEENRAIKDTERCNLSDIPKEVLYNCANDISVLDKMIPSQKKNGRMIYFGTIHRQYTLGEYFLHEEMQPVLLDIYGLITGWKQLCEFIEDLPGNLRYKGYLDSVTLNRILKEYCYSLVMWNPISENQLYAAPNKFFESIAAGVPPIAAPHPQCKLIIDRYKCGIVAEDWSFEAILSAIQKGLEIYGTEAYDSMMEGCRKAVTQELAWEKQFEKVKQYLKPLE